MTDHINAGVKNPTYATYVGRVGALALALGIGAAMATGHGLGLGVAYATEGDPSTDTSQDDNTNDGAGDDTGTTPPAPSATAEAPGGSSQPRSPLARIANVPKMIFNATGGAQKSATVGTQPRLPRLSTVIEDVASAVTNNLPKLPAPAQGAVPQGNPGAGSGLPVTSRSASNADSRDLVPAVTSLPASVANEFKALVSVPAGARTQTRPSLTPSAVVPSGIQRQALVDNGQQDVVQPSAALLQTPTNPPPINPVGVVTRLLTVALSGLVAPGPAAPTDPPLLLGVLAWARREIQLNFFNRTPNAIPDAVTTGEDANLPATGNVLTNDRAENPDGSTETLTVTNPGTYTSSKGTLVLAANGSYTYTPLANANGPDVFTYTVSDEASRPHIHGLRGLLYGGGHTDTATLTVNITPVNDAPTVVAPIQDQSTNEDALYNYTIPTSTFNDVDGDALTYSATGLPAGLTYNAATRTISGTPTTPGTYTITVTAADAGTTPATDTFTLAVVNTNDAPVVANEIPDQTVDEDAAYSYTTQPGTFTDIDGNTLTYTATGLPTGVTINPTTGVISGTPTTPGTYTITVTATDTSNATADDTFSLAVVNTNDAPVVANEIPDQTVDEDAAYSYTTQPGTFTDIDGNTLTYTATGLPTGVTINPTTGVISGTPTTPGTYTITVTATDTSNATADDTFSLAVVNTNDAPVVANEIPDQTVDEDAAYSYTTQPGTFTDIDGNTLTYTATGLPTGVTINPTTGVISGTPTTPGTYTITVTATDTSNATADDTFSLNVTPAGSPATVFVGAGTTTLDSGAQSYDIATSKDGKRTYVVLSDGRVQVFDTSGTTPSSLGTTPNIGTSQTSSVAVSADGKRAFVTSPNTDKVWIIDSSTSTITATSVDVGDQPTGVAVSDDGSRAYVTNSGGNTVTMIDASSGPNPTATPTSITVGNNPYDVAVSADGKRAFVTNRGSGTVSIIDTHGPTTVSDVTVGSQPREIKVNDDGTVAILWHNRGTFAGDATIIKGTDSDATVTNISGPFVMDGEDGFIAISDDGDVAYFTDHNNRLAVVDTTTASPTPVFVSIPNSPHAMTINGDGSVAHMQTHAGGLYVYDRASGQVTYAPVSGFDANATDFEQVASSEDGTRVVFTDAYGRLAVATFTTPTPPSAV